MAIIIVVLVGALLFLAFFSIYVRRCAMAGAQDSSAGAENGTTAHSAVSLRTKGLEKSVVESLPVVHFKDLNLQDKMDHGKKTEDGGDGENEEVEPHRECAVCLSEFEADDSLRLLPKCKHIFHLECIDVWFQSHSTCPLCRAAIVQEDDHDQQVHDDERERHRSIFIHEEQEHEGEESEEAHEAALQSPHDFVVTIDRGDAGEESARETLGLQQPAVLLLARTRSGISATEGMSGSVGPSISRADQRDSARVALFRNAHSFKKAARGVVAHERAGMSPGPRLETRTSSKSWRKTPTPIIEPMRRSTSLDSDGKYMKDLFSNNNQMPKLVSQHSLPAAMKLATNLPTTPKSGSRRTGSGLEFFRTGSGGLNSLEKARLTGSQSIRSNSEHWVSIQLDTRPESLGDASSKSKPVQQQLGMNESPRGTETGRSARWSFLNLRNALSPRRSASELALDTEQLPS